MLYGGVKQRIGMLALALELNIMVNSTGISCQHVCLLLKSYNIDIELCWRRCCRVILVTALPSPDGNSVA
jgi:hypothetical protein